MLFYYEIKKTVGNKIFTAVIPLASLITVFFAYRASQTYVTSEKTPGELQSEYASKLSAYIETASDELEDLRSGGFENSGYGWNYFSNVKQIYETAKDTVVFSRGTTPGWDQLFNFNILYFVQLVCAVAAGALSFCEEKRKGSAMIIRPAANGRGRTAAAKLSAAAVTALSVSVFFSVLGALLFAVFSGLDGALAPLQTSPVFKYSPFLYTNLEAYLITCLFSALFSNYIIIVAASAAIPAVEFALFSGRYTSVHVFVKNVNLFAYCDTYLLERYFSVRWLGCTLPGPWTALFAALIAAVCAALAYAVHCGSGASGAVRIKLLRLPQLRYPKAKKRSLFSWEFRKKYVNTGVAFIAAALLVFRVVLIITSYPVKNTGSEAKYRAVAEGYAPVGLPAAYADYEEESSRVIAEMADAYLPERLHAAGEITEEEYNELAARRDEDHGYYSILNRLERRFDYLTAARAENGDGVRFVYDTGLEKLFGAEADFFLLLIIMLFTVNSFCSDSESGADPLIRATGGGRGKRFIITLSTCAGVSMISYAVVAAAELFALRGSGIFDNTEYLASSVASASGAGDMTIGGFITAAVVLRGCAYVCYAVTACAVSNLSGKTLLSAVITASVSAVPFCLRLLGLDMKYADVTGFMTAHAVLGRYGTSAFVMFIPLLSVAAVLTVLSAVKSAATPRKIPV